MYVSNLNDKGECSRGSIDSRMFWLRENRSCSWNFVRKSEVQKTRKFSRMLTDVPRVTVSRKWWNKERCNFSIILDFNVICTMIVLMYAYYMHYIYYYTKFNPGSSGCTSSHGLLYEQREQSDGIRVWSHRAWGVIGQIAAMAGLHGWKGSRSAALRINDASEKVYADTKGLSDTL